MQLVEWSNVAPESHYLLQHVQHVWQQGASLQPPNYVHCLLYIEQAKAIVFDATYLDEAHIDIDFDFPNNLHI